MRTPSSFFSFFGNPGGAASADFAVEAFEDDVKVAGRQVSRPRLQSPMCLKISS
jgi:syntaxin-binding protein 1